MRIRPPKTMAHWVRWTVAASAILASSLTSQAGAEGGEEGQEQERYPSQKGHADSEALNLLSLPEEVSRQRRGQGCAQGLKAATQPDEELASKHAEQKRWHEGGCGNEPLPGLPEGPMKDLGQKIASHRSAARESFGHGTLLLEEAWAAVCDAR